MPFDASGIYRIINLINGKVYIGSAVYLNRRKREHWNRLKANKHHSSYLQRAWNKDGQRAFEFQIIERCEKEKLIALETFYIKTTDCTNEEKGYNSCEFGVSALGRKHSEETKLKIGLGNKGKIISAETREKYKKALAGKKRDPELMKRISQSRIGQKQNRKPRTSEQLQIWTERNRELANRRWRKVRELKLNMMTKNQLNSTEGN